MPDTDLAEPQTAPSSVTETSASQDVPQAQGQDGASQKQGETFFDPNNLPPELRPKWDEMNKAYTQKTQGIAETKKYADAFRQLVSDREFLTWYNGRKNGPSQAAPTQPKPEESPYPAPSQEEWEALKDDPVKFAKWQQSAFEKMVESKYAPQIQQDREQLASLKAEHETNVFAQEHPDFWKLDALTQDKPEDPGLMEIMTAAGLDLNTAYTFGKRIMDQIQKNATQAAHDLVERKKAASIEQSGATPPSSAGVRKVRGGLAEAIRAAAEEAAEGRSTTISRER